MLNKFIYKQNKLSEQEKDIIKKIWEIKNNAKERIILESLILANISNENIEKKLGLLKKDIEYYKKMFYDIEEYNYLQKSGLLDNIENAEEQFLKTIAIKYDKKLLLFLLFRDDYDYAKIVKAMEGIVIESFFQMSHRFVVNNDMKTIINIYKTISSKYQEPDTDNQLLDIYNTLQSEYNKGENGESE